MISWKLSSMKSPQLFVMRMDLYRLTYGHPSNIRICGTALSTCEQTHVISILCVYDHQANKFQRGRSASKYALFVLNLNIECHLSKGILNWLVFSQNQIYINKVTTQMSKQKKLRRIVLDKLYPKNDAHLKKSTRSNAPTESTPNQIKNSANMVEQFFDNFDTQCAIIYEPVRLLKHKPLKRCLQGQLNQLYSDGLKAQKFKTQASYDTYQPKGSNYLKSHQSKKINKNSNFVRLTTQFQSTRLDSPLFQFQEKQPVIKRNNSEILKVSSPLADYNSRQKKYIDLLELYDQKNSSALKLGKNKSSKNLKKVERAEQNYCSNARHIISKNESKNAPKKNYQRAVIGIGNQRIKRIQSLKQLNQNGARKYTYKKQ